MKNTEKFRLSIAHVSILFIFLSELVPHEIGKSLKLYPMLYDKKYAEETGLPEDTYALPAFDEKRVIYKVLTYDPLLDSSNIDMKDWIKMVTDIENHYTHYDGFVVLHGTDTMAYTASALSFMTEHLQKPVIVTGSQLPISELRSDGIDNILGAVYIAGYYCIAEVTLFFHNKLFRGNRCQKISAEGFAAFGSPNLSPLVTMGVNIDVSWHIIRQHKRSSTLKVYKNMNEHVGLLTLFPGITSQTMQAFLQPPMKGVVLETFGAGNFPSDRKDLVEAVKSACTRGVIVINCTQCLKGYVHDFYETGEVLVKAGVVDGSDMTPEAALTKLSFVLGLDLPIEEKKKIMATDIRGEMTIFQQKSPGKQQENKLIRAVADTLLLCSEEDVKVVSDTLYPSMMCAAARNGEMETLTHFRDCDSLSRMTVPKPMQFLPLLKGGNLSACDYDGRTALHLAAAQGNYDVVKFLLANGCSMYVRDRFGHTPFLAAILNEHFDIIELMRGTGGHIIEENMPNLLEYVISSASSGNVSGLKAFRTAGADLALCDYAGNTALHVAVISNQLDCVSYLLESGLDAERENKLGQTPLTLAGDLNQNETLLILTQHLDKIKEQI